MSAATRLVRRLPTDWRSVNERDGGETWSAGVEGGVGWPAGHWVGVGEWVDDREREERRRRGALNRAPAMEMRNEGRKRARFAFAIPMRGQRGEKRASGGGPHRRGSLSRRESRRRRKRRRENGAALDGGMTAALRGETCEDRGAFRQAFRTCFLDRLR